MKLPTKTGEWAVVCDLDLDPSQVIVTGLGLWADVSNAHIPVYKPVVEFYIYILEMMMDARQNVKNQRNIDQSQSEVD